MTPMDPLHLQPPHPDPATLGAGWGLDAHGRARRLWLATGLGGLAGLGLPAAWAQTLEALPGSAAAGSAAAGAARAGPNRSGSAAATPDRAPQRLAGADHGAAADVPPGVRHGRPLTFPRDHGAHPETGLEWWYVTGWLHEHGRPEQPRHGFQLTFFRLRRPAQDLGPADEAERGGRYVPRQLLFAHAAWTDLAAGRHRHAQRLLRWSGDERLPSASALAARSEARLRTAAWQLERRPDGVWQARLPAPEAGFGLALELRPTQPLLLQGEAGFSRKGAAPTQASHYYSLPQLDVRAELTGSDGGRSRWSGRAWLDHEWSDALMPPEAVGWDWLGINLLDGGALTAFRLRDAQGRAVWAGGSHRAASGSASAPASTSTSTSTNTSTSTSIHPTSPILPVPVSDPAGRLQIFKPEDLSLEPLAWWTSPATGGRYPVQWRLQTPQGERRLRALLDAQELDGRSRGGPVYWEGLSELTDAAGRRLGLGYLEMTGYAGRLRLG